MSYVRWYIYFQVPKYSRKIKVSCSVGKSSSLEITS